MRCVFRSRTLLVGLALLLGSCKACERAPAVSLVELAPTDATAAVLVADLGELATALDAFLVKATSRGGAELYKGLRGGLERQAGFDVFAPEAYARIGVAASAGALVWAEAGSPEPVVALALTDRKVFTKWLEGTLGRIDGAEQVKAEKVGAVEIFVAGRPFGDELVPVAVWSFVKGAVLVARGDGKDSLARAVARATAPADPAGTPVASLATNAVFRELSKKVPTAPVLVFVPSTAARELGADVDAAQALSNGAITAVTPSAKGLVVDAFVSMRLPDLAGVMGQGTPAGLAARIEDDAVVALVTTAAGGAGVRALRAHGATSGLIDRALRPMARETGLDAERDILPLLAGPLTAALHVTDVASLPQALAERRSLNALLDFLHVSITAEVKDPAAMLVVLERSKAEIEKRGFAFRKTTKKVGAAEAIVFEPDRPEPLLGWALVGKTYVYGAGRGRLERAMAALTGEKKSLAPVVNSGVTAELAAEPGSTVLLVRAGSLASAAGTVLRGAGSERLAGLGGLVTAALGVVQSLGDVAISARADGEGLRLKVREQLQ